MTRKKRNNETFSLSYLNIFLPSGPSPSFIAEQNAAISFPLSSIVFFTLLFSPLYLISRPVTRSFCDSSFHFTHRKQGRIFSGDFVGRRGEGARRRRRRRRQNSRRRRSRDCLLAEQARNNFFPCELGVKEWGAVGEKERTG